MDVGVAFPPGAQPAELVQPAGGALHRLALAARAEAVRGAAPGEDRGDAAFSRLSAVCAVVVGTVGP